MFDWLEYSEVKDVAYCLPCFLFGKMPKWWFGGNTFTIEGFHNWKKVNNGMHFSFFILLGNGPCSLQSNIFDILHIKDVLLEVSMKVPILKIVAIFFS
jgi:hypothetical protein